MKAQPLGKPEGIYFNLSNEEYHNDPALSHSGMTKLLVSWPDYWISSCHNPDREKYQPTAAMQFGERSAMYLLEPKKFADRFWTTKDNAPIGKRTGLSSTEFGKIRESVDCITDMPIAKEHFTNGYAEVAIFWRDKATGIMLRAKIDYLRTFGAIDMKRIKAIDNWTIGRAVKDQGLDIQHHLYLEGIKAAREMLLKYQRTAKTKQSEGMLKPWHGDVDLDWLEAFTHEKDLLFRFLFQRSTPPFIWEFRELDPEVVQEGANAVNAALLKFKDGITRYGTARPPYGEAVVKPITQFHVPRRDYDYE